MSSEVQHHRALETPIGLVTVTAQAGALVRLDLPSSQASLGPTPDPESSDSNHAVLDAVSQWLFRYFDGDPSTPDFLVRPEGTAFQHLVWAEVRKIAFGETTSYGAIAASLGKPGSSRAVGLANANNPVPLVVPCHRVIGAQGQLTGYAGGMALKRRLLNLEGSNRGQLELGL